MYASYSVVPHVAMQHRNTCSDVGVAFSGEGPSDLHAALQDGRLDAAISFSETATPGIHSLALLREPLIAALLPTTPRFNTSISGLNHSVMTRSSRFRARALRCSMMPSFISASKLDLVRK
ncbi:LysR substrate-binding domain-containing protein [Klebsiella variicola subsp. variicola]|nr:LysR substrate-binding domain-containing protein [Klebsiella variicola subsp. variicola]